MSFTVALDPIGLVGFPIWPNNNLPLGSDSGSIAAVVGGDRIETSSPLSAAPPSLKDAYDRFVPVQIVAQVVPPEPPPEPDPVEREPKDDVRNNENEPAGPRSERPMSQSELAECARSTDPFLRSAAYQNEIDQLDRLDPVNPALRPQMNRAGWSPTGNDIVRLSDQIEEAKDAKSRGFSPEQYGDLARDPARGGAVTKSSVQERSAVMAAVRNGSFRGSPRRDPSGQSEFLDNNGKQWDAKAFRSDFPNGFSKTDSVRNVETKLRAGINVIVDTRAMSESDVTSLQGELVARGWPASRVMYVNSTLTACPNQ